MRPSLGLWVGIVLAAAAGTAAAPADAGDKPGKAAKAAKAAKRRGKVVRVERGRQAGGRTPRMCYNVRPDGHATCYGIPVAVGDAAVIVNDQEVVATARLTGVVGQGGGCGHDEYWEVAYDVQTGSVANLGYTGFLLVDWPSTRETRSVDGSRVVLPSARPGEAVWAAFDNDDDGTPDHVVTSYACDPAGNPGGGAYCIGYYERDGGSYRELRRDVRPTC